MSGFQSSTSYFILIGWNTSENTWRDSLVYHEQMNSSGALVLAIGGESAKKWIIKEQKVKKG